MKINLYHFHSIAQQVELLNCCCQLMLAGQKRAQPFRDQGAYAPSKKKKANQHQSGSANQSSSSAKPQKKQGGRKKNRGSAPGQGSGPKSGGKGSQPKKD